MTVQESINRGLNLLGTSIVALAGFAFSPEALVENEMPDRLDDILLFFLGLAAIAWYMRSNNRYVRSIAPVVFVLLALFIKIVGIIIEHNDPADLGDDLGGLILFIGAAILIVYQYFKTKRLLEAEEMSSPVNSR